MHIDTKGLQPGSATDEMIGCPGYDLAYLGRGMLCGAQPCGDRGVTASLNSELSSVILWDIL